MLKVSISILLPIILAFISHKLNISYSTVGIQKVSDITLTISGMIFTIMGVWIAFIYPNAILRLKSKKLETADFTENQEEKNRLERIVGAIIQSSIAAIAILITAIINTTANTTDTIANPIIAAIVITAALLQIEGVFQVVYSNTLFLNDLHSKTARKKTDQQL